jgi:hypothetical protein
MTRIKLQYPELEKLTISLFENIQRDYSPDTIIHPGIRTDFLITRATDFFHQEVFSIDTSRPLPLKNIMRKFFCEALDSLPDSMAERIVEAYTTIVHSEHLKPQVREEYVKELPKNLGRVLLLDDVFCTGQTVEAVSSSIQSLSPSEIKVGTLIFTPRNNLKPDYFALEGRYSLPWRNVGI